VRSDLLQLSDRFRLREAGKRSQTWDLNKTVMKKYTILTTLKCNLRCKYCYIAKRELTISSSTAQKMVDFIYRNTPSDEKIDLGFFGGEPLLEFDVLERIVETIESHPMYAPERLELSVTTNGTVFTPKIAEFLRKHRILFCLSCDGPPGVQDLFRVFPDNRGSSAVVEQTIRQARETLPVVLVNAVYHPQTFRLLPEAVRYFSSLGLRQIYLNPDFSAPWSKQEADELPEVYRQIGNLYTDYYIQRDPHFISLIDSKIAAILRGGYQPSEKCQMGKRELAFSPDGHVYLCERLVGSGEVNEHCIGHIDNGFRLGVPPCAGGRAACTNPECLECAVRDYCMNWCGCSNYFATGSYDRVGPFLCASERAAIQVAFRIFQELEAKMGPVFMEHLAGGAQLNSLLKI
jgi:uncharacterized protein